MKDENQQKAIYKDPQTQEMLNKPVQDPSGMAEEDKALLKEIVRLIDEGKIDPLKPSSVLNQEVYEKLSDELKAKADMEVMNILSAIRDIKGLHDMGDENSFQLQNLVSRLRLTKERIEEESGDIFLI